MVRLTLWVIVSECGRVASPGLGREVLVPFKILVRMTTNGFWLRSMRMDRSSSIAHAEQRSCARWCQTYGRWPLQVPQSRVKWYLRSLPLRTATKQRALDCACFGPISGTVPACPPSPVAMGGSRRSCSAGVSFLERWGASGYMWARSIDHS